jgi:Na+/alanine symporter
VGIILINMKSVLAALAIISTVAFAHQEEAAAKVDTTHGKTSDRLLDLT